MLVARNKLALLCECERRSLACCLPVAVSRANCISRMAENLLKHTHIQPESHTDRRTDLQRLDAVAPDKRAARHAAHYRIPLASAQFRNSLQAHIATLCKRRSQFALYDARYCGCGCCGFCGFRCCYRARIGANTGAIGCHLELHRPIGVSRALVFTATSAQDWPSSSSSSSAN